MAPAGPFLQNSCRRRTVFAVTGQAVQKTDSPIPAGTGFPAVPVSYTHLDFPNQSYDPNAPTTNNKGWRVYGWEFNVTGACLLYTSRCV